MIYLILLFFILIGVFLYDIKKYKKKKVEYFYFIFILMSLITGLSYRLGGDIINYIYEYDEYVSIFDNKVNFLYFFSFHDRMPLWVFFNVLFRTIDAEFYLFHLFQVCMINFAVCSVLKKYTNCSFCSILLYGVLAFPLFNYEIMRESLAVSVFLYSVRFFVKFRFFPYYICSLIAFGFHMSAIVLFIIPLIKLIPNTKIGTMIMIVGCLFILLFSDLFISYLLVILNVDFLAQKAFGYFTRERYGSSTLSISFLANILFYLFLPYYVIYLHNKNNNVKELEIYRLVAIYSIVYCCSQIVPIFYRVNNYFVIFFIAYFVNTTSVKYSKQMIINKITHQISFFIIVLFICLKINNVYLAPVGYTSFPSYRRYIPYSSIFTEERDLEREKFYL